MNEEDDSEPGPSSKSERRELKTAGASALFDLKGELYRKKREQKIRNEAQLSSTGPKRNILLISKEEEKKRDEDKAKRQRRIKDLEKGIREDEEQEKSRLRAQKILEEKAAAYDRLARGEVLLQDDGQSVDFLVDFSAKKREDAEKRMEEKRREEEDAAKNEAVHYVPGDEQREYGVSHIPFSASEEKRQQQMRELLQMSKETEVAQEKRKKILEIRRLANLERLNKLRIRKGLEPVPLEEEPGKEEEEIVGPFLDIPMPSAPSPQEAKSKEKPEEKPQFGVREWDKGKLGYKRWIESERSERNEEFRPPKSYYL